MKPIAIPLTLVLAVLSATPSQTPNVREYPTPLVREEQTVMVNGKPEVWQLQWAKAPQPSCEPSEESLTCPCEGFAYGESGKLFISRTRDGREIERLPLTNLFEETDGAVLQRWPKDEKDYDLLSGGKLSSEASKRPVTQIMHFADFDHDGQATEFYLQTSAGPCGRTSGVVVGVSQKDDHLHVLTSTAHPHKPLVLAHWEWQFLLKDASGQTHVVDIPCYDHGAEFQDEFTLRPSAAGITGTRYQYNCPEKGQIRKLRKKEPI